MFLAEAPGGGTDTVEAWVDYTLPSEVENIVIAGTWAMRATGNALPNRIAGNTGADTLAGRGGDDVLSGGRGADRFIVRAGEGHDTITDFEAGSDAGHDTVLLVGYSYATVAEVLAALRASGADTVLDFRNGETLTFEGVARAAFTADDFVLASVTAPPGFAAVPASPAMRKESSMLCV